MSACHEITILVNIAPTLIVRKISKSPDYLSIQWSFKTYLHHICQTWFLWLTVPLHGVRVSQNQFLALTKNKVCPVFSGYSQDIDLKFEIQPLGMTLKKFTRAIFDFLSIAREMSDFTQIWPFFDPYFSVFGRYLGL